MGIPLPQHGAFGGNGDNDAWEQASRYATWVINGPSDPNGVPNGTVPIELDANGHPSVVKPPAWMQAYEMPRTAENIGAVSNIMAAIGREPVNALDGLYYRHDLLSTSDQTITAAQNNAQVSGDLFTALTNSGDYGFNGTVYGTVAAFGLPTVGTTIQPFLDFGEQYNSSNDQSLTFQDETIVEPIYVIAVRDSGGIVHAIVDGVIELKAAVYQAGRDAWNGFTSALDYTWKSFSGFVSDTAAGVGGILDKAWDFVKHLFADSPATNAFASDEAASIEHSKLVLVETNKEKNTDYDKGVLAMIDAGQKAGTVSTMALGDANDVRDFLTSALNRYGDAANRPSHQDTSHVTLIEEHPANDVSLVGVHEASLSVAV